MNAAQPERRPKERAIKTTAGVGGPPTAIPAYPGAAAGEPVSGESFARLLDAYYVSDLADFQVPPLYIREIPIAFSRAHRVLAVVPVTTEPSEADTAPWQIAIEAQAAWGAVDVLRRYLRRPLEPLISSGDAILRRIDHAYQLQQDRSREIVEGLVQSSDLDLALVTEGREDLLDNSARSPVIQLVNSILFEGVKSRASDIHIQPRENQLIVRQRIDGVLFDTLEVPKEHQEEVISRFKVLGKMNIAEKRLPQDGRATVRLGNRVVELRIASLPTSFGERVVIRLLDKHARLYSLAELGMDNQTLERFRRLVRLEHGLVLVTGPTGGGKSTTLYAALQEINSRDLNVLTLEDPIEYVLEGISQTQVNSRKGMTFASGLRNVLRQDPDIIMVGEIRDQETAVMAIQSALTGHLVLSTLHTNDAASAVTRLLDLEIEPYLVASSVTAVVAQRLVRRICSECRQGFIVSEDELLRLGLDPRLKGSRAFRGQGCSACRNTGYHGRVGVFELLEIDEAIRSLIISRSAAAEIRDSALQRGLRLLADDGLHKVQNGITTLDEVARISAKLV